MKTTLAYPDDDDPVTRLRQRQEVQATTTIHLLLIERVAKNFKALRKEEQRRHQ